MEQDGLERAVRDHPFDDFQTWWPVGDTFATFMSRAVRETYGALPASADVVRVRPHFDRYLGVVYRRKARPGVFEALLEGTPSGLESGEFDAFSYACYRSAFEHLAENPGTLSDTLERERRRFTQAVGKRFFAQLERHLELDLPETVTSAEDFRRLRAAIVTVGGFLKSQGYLRDHFGFHFEVALSYHGEELRQREEDVLERLQRGLAYALYEMGYPVILPSAVYLYQTVGEAQHHSSRTIEDLFERAGLQAREVDDFDPRDYPSDRVVELWEIRPR